MSYQVLIPRKIEKELTSLPNPLIEKIIKVLHSLEKDPFPANSKKLHNRDGYRLRVGYYRIIYEIDTGREIITLQRIAHRKDVYRH